MNVNERNNVHRWLTNIWKYFENTHFSYMAPKHDKVVVEERCSIFYYMFKVIRKTQIVSFNGTFLCFSIIHNQEWK
jgi:hypothetical protein